MGTPTVDANHAKAEDAEAEDKDNDSDSNNYNIDADDLESVDSHPYDNIYPKPPSTDMYPDINCMLESAARVTGLWI